MFSFFQSVVCVRLSDPLIENVNTLVRPLAPSTKIIELHQKKFWSNFSPISDLEQNIFIRISFERKYPKL